MGSRFVTAVALYGPKAEPARSFLAGVQAVVAGHLGDSFRPYSLEQIHGTLILLSGVPDPRTGAIVNECHLERTGVGAQMDLTKAMRILTAHLATPIRVRIGGHPPDAPVPFLSRGQHLYQRAFSTQVTAYRANALVLMGWPAAALTGPDRPLNSLRRDMNSANVHHRYHSGDADIDDDFHLVVGHYSGAPAEAVTRAVEAVRAMLAADAVELEVGLDQVKVIASDSHTLAPARFVSGVPVAEAVLRDLMS